MNKKGRVRLLLIKITGFFIIFSILILGLKLYSIGIDKFNLAFRSIKVCTNCNITVNNQGTVIKKTGNDGYSFSKIISTTSKGVAIGDKITKVISLYNISNNYAKWKLDDTQEVLFITNDLDLATKKQLYFVYTKKNNKWVLKNLSNNEELNNEEAIIYFFNIEKGKIISFEIEHKNN